MNPRRKMLKLQRRRRRSDRQLRPRHSNEQEQCREDSPSHSSYHNRMRYSLLLTLLLTSIVSLPAFGQVSIYGILLEPKSKGRHPPMICIHGMSSSPEAVCGLSEKPDYANSFGLQLVQRGYLVFAPLDINNFKTRSWLD